MRGECEKMDYFLSALAFLSITILSQTNPAVIKAEAQSNLVSIAFDRDIDTCVNVYSAITIYPGLFGCWKWRNNRELDFISDSFIPDTTVYVLNINSELKDISGNAVGPTGFIFTASKSISYNFRRVPPQWEGNLGSPDVEIDWGSGLKLYTIKSRIHSLYKSVIAVVFCWDHIYNGTLRTNYASPIYPHFITSASHIYKAAVDPSGALYLINRPHRQQYRWFIFPENQFYHALDVSNKGEVLIAISTSKADTMSEIYLLSPAAEIIWTKKFCMHNHNDMIIDLSFINTVDKFVLHIDGRVYCFKMQRVE